MKRLFLYIAAMWTVGAGMSSCDMLESHPYDVDVAYRNINRDAIRQIEADCAGKETIRYVWMGDTQRWYDETEDFVRHVNARGDIDFVMHGGDISDFGMGREFDWVHKIMRKLDMPYLALIGNHDLLGNGLDVYEKMYGELDFSFVVGQMKFVCVNTNALEFDYSHSVPDFLFLRGEIRDTRPHEQTIVAMHANPFGEQFNNNVADIFQDYIKRLKNLRFCMHAHAHRLMVNDFFEDGVIYYGCSAMKDRCYMVFTVTPDDYSYEVVYY